MLEHMLNWLAAHWWQILAFAFLYRLTTMVEGLRADVNELQARGAPPDDWDEPDELAVATGEE